MKQASVALFALLASLSACTPQVGTRPTPEAFDVELRARNDDGVPISKASWSTGSQALGESGGDGLVALTLRGREGQTLPILLACPDGFSAPSVLPSLRLTHTRRLSDGKPQPLLVEGTCTREGRDVTVVVHVENGSMLPVSVDGQSAGTTDRDGNAHVLLRIDRSVRKLDVAVDTSSRPELSPKSPARSFELAGRDGLLIFTDKLSIARAITRVAGKPKTKFVPYRVD